MKLIIDTDAKRLTCQENGAERVLDLYTPEAFHEVSRQWLRVGWSQKYTYRFTWLGRPVIQLPEDMLLIQEVLFRVQPDVVIECGVAHGGSLIFYASLFRLLGKGRAIGVDVRIRPENRHAIETHPLADAITLVEGSSTDPAVVQHVHSLVKPGERVLVVLDSNHSKEHVLAELRAYSPLVSPDSYIVAMDGIMAELPDLERAKPDWSWNNPQEAAREFSEECPQFRIEDPPYLFTESPIEKRVTYGPQAFLKRVA